MSDLQDIAIKLKDVSREELEGMYLVNTNALRLQKEENEKLKLSSNRWNALMSCERIRVLGSANLGKGPYQHIGLEIWTEYNNPAFKANQTQHEESKLALTLFVDTQAKLI